MTQGESPLPLLAHGIVERIDDYCAVAFTVCQEAQAVPRLERGATPSPTSNASPTNPSRRKRR